MSADERQRIYQTALRQQKRDLCVCGLHVLPDTGYDGNVCYFFEVILKIRAKNAVVH
jgi:hypothetical protein